MYKRVSFTFAVSIVFVFIVSAYAAKSDMDPVYKKVKKEHVDIIKKMDKGVSSQSVELPWRLYNPVKDGGAEAGKDYPIVFVLHGAGSRGNDNITPMGIANFFWAPEVQAKNPCFVLAPHCPRGSTWAPIPRVPGVRAVSNYTASAEALPVLTEAFSVLDQIVEKYDIDKSRIYITGFSMGGYGTWDALLRRPNMWAAAVPICGGGDPTKVALYKDIPIWVWHGVNDTTVTPVASRELVDALKKAGGAPKYSEINKGHGSWASAYTSEELQSWLFEQKKDQNKDQ